MLTILFGLGASLAYGAADFFGAIGSRKLRPVIVTGLAAWSGLALLLVVQLVGLFGAKYPPEVWLLGVVGGICSAIALSCLYIALAIGPISILSPLSAVLSAIVPTVVAVIGGETFSWLGWLAIGLVLIAVVLVGFVPGDDVRVPSAKGLIAGTIAGVGIGAVLLCLAAAPSDTGIAMVTLLRLFNGILLSSFLVIQVLRRKVAGKEFTGITRGTWVVIMLCGFLDAGANLLFTEAVRSGTITVTAVLTALYPLGTILLARIVLKERIARSQQLGIGLVLAASVLLALA